MGFNSALLCANNIKAELSGIQSMVESRNNRPHIYDILEYNSDIQDIDFRSKIDQYRLMVEGVYKSDNNESLAIVSEGLIGNIIDRLINIINKIIEFIRNTIKNIFSFGRSHDEKVKSFQKEANKAKNINEHDDIWKKSSTFKIFCYPDLRNIDSSQFTGSIGTMLTHLERLSNDEDVKISDKDKKMGYKALYRMMKKSVKSSRDPVSRYEGNVVDSKSFADYVKTELCFIVNEEMRIWDWHMKYVGDPLNAVFGNLEQKYRAELKVFDQYLTKAKDILIRAKNGGSVSSEHLKDMELVVGYIEQIATSYTNFLVTIYKYHNSYIDYATKVLKKINADAYSDNYTNESGMIHGETFNSDTLFDNEDLRDFNRTEWLDLNLTMEFYNMKHELTDSKRTIFIKEAQILADEKPNKIARLTAMREAEEKKSNNVVMNIINRIKEIFSKFIQSFTAKFNTTSIYIRKNKSFIDKPITIKSMKSRGDILAGMYRSQYKLRVIPFDYNTMKDDLADKKTFFAKRILPDLNKGNNVSKRKIAWSDDMEVATYCKIYFGAAMPEDKYPGCEYTGADMEANKNNIVRFLTEKNISFSAKDDLANLERESKKMSSIAAVSTPQQSSDSSSSTASSTSSSTSSTETKPKSESAYYSELYGRWLTEADIEMGEVKEGSKEGGTKPNNDIYNAYRVYMECYKDVILAKITGTEFVFSELKQLISTHVASHGGQKISDNQQPANK